MLRDGFKKQLHAVGVHILPVQLTTLTSWVNFQTMHVVAEGFTDLLCQCTVMEI